MSKERFVVHYHHNPIDDLDLLRTNRREYFNTETEAKEFMQKWKYKEKPFYYQPMMHKEKYVERTVGEWVLA